MNFRPFPKLARLSREVIITEKLDGTNAQITIKRRDALEFDEQNPSVPFIEVRYEGVDYVMLAGSRNRWVTIGDDNFGFAGWVNLHKQELVKLGEGTHFGEWWGKGIQRGYDLEEKRFSLFNVHRWGGDETARPACCHVVPVLWRGNFITQAAENALARLKLEGGLAAPGYRNPEGVVIFHTHANVAFKKTLGDDGHKGNG